MEIRVSHRVVYETTEEVAIDDVIASLMGTRRALKEAGELLESCFDGLKVESVSTQVRSISQESPLRELFVFSLIVGFQKELEEEIPLVLEKMIGVQLSDQYDTIVTVCTLIVLFYGADFLYQKYIKATAASAISKQLDGLIEELSQQTGKSQETIRAVLKERYKRRGLMELGRAAANFFQPSKRQRNVPLSVGSTRISKEVVETIPAAVNDANLKPEPTSEPMENVLIQVHAQDVDYSKRGWAAVLPDVSPERIKMKVFPPIQPEEIYNRGLIRGDIVLVSESMGGETYPVECHLVRLRDDKP